MTMLWQVFYIKKRHTHKRKALQCGGGGGGGGMLQKVFYIKKTQTKPPDTRASPSAKTR